ncbi:MYND-type domain-containing protein [Caenorhabditis elegans]|uniref:MYND-type domain-containing protein n=1 Tax=Caenorhabditis elegans TaxID=6239 RepID=Q20741_CAEEL|nr:MYND-type domain-containing protein [Caenorhabditis elegans]CAA94138.1 MYND-type domain-containing protein [Caenorhabditis elegans]|eukprot:NP_510277.1 BMP Receptor Associated protein family [Caenorhabditis elegans]
MSEEAEAGPSPKVNGENGNGTNTFDDLYVDDKMRRMIVDLQRQWLTDYHDSREKSLVALTEKLHQEFMEDQERVRRDLLVQFKIELDQTKEELEKKHAENLKEEIEKLSEKHQRELAVAKKKQWCWQCNSEAIYHCCWNTAYCSVECQQGHWQIHRKFCRRKKSNGGAPGPVQPIAEPTQSQQ